MSVFLQVSEYTLRNICYLYVCLYVCLCVCLCVCVFQQVSEYTLRNVCYLCEHGAPAAITAVFRSAGPGTHTAGLPPTLAHALVVVAVNLKMWMAGAAGSELMAPLRPAVIGYMCQLNEAELKSSAVRSLSGQCCGHYQVSVRSLSGQCCGYSHVTVRSPR